MSLRVLIIPEDFRTDSYMLQPIIKAMFVFLEKPNAKVQVCAEPNLGGDGQALKKDRIREVIDMYSGMVDIFILCVDRDGKDNRKVALDNLEVAIKQDNDVSREFLAENAWQELEAWILVGLDSRPKGWKIKDIRAANHPKEDYFEPLAIERGFTGSPGGGRKEFGIEAAKNYSLLRKRCPEDILALETRIKALVN